MTLNSLAAQYPARSYRNRSLSFRTGQTINLWLRTPFLLALIALTSACSGTANEAEEHYNAGSEFLNRGLLQEAIAEFDQAISLDLQYAEAFNQRGTAYVVIGDMNFHVLHHDKW